METNPFIVRDCALIPLATGLRAQNLRELKNQIREAPPACVYYHFWGGLLRAKFDDPEFPNDFASWSQHSLHDKRLAERLAIINPTDFEDLEDLRREVLDVVDERLDELDFPPWVETDQQFHFIRSQIVVFNTNIEVRTPRELRDRMPSFSSGTIFYHFIDARRRFPYKRDDFSAWLETCEDVHDDLVLSIKAIDPYFTTLEELRKELKGILDRYFKE